MSQLGLLLLMISCCWAANWQLPTPADVRESLARCRTDDDDATTLKCLVSELGLWTDASGYNAKRIAKIFAPRQQMQELVLVIEHCNRREQQEAAPAIWAYEAYKCATAGTFGRWVEDYMGQ